MGLDKTHYIGILATGYNIVDLGAAQAKDIAVTNVPDYSSRIVAQHSLALLLAICSDLPFYAGQVKRGGWPMSSSYYDGDHPIIELAGLTLGIAGYGQIGQEMVKLARALGMEVIAYDKDPIDPIIQVSLEDLYARSDVISLHLPLNKETRGMINKASLGQMKKGVILINTARGGLIVEEDLAQALKSGRVYAAGLDVLA